MHPAQTQIPPDLKRFNALREEHAGLLASVGVEIPDLGTSARLTFKPIDLDEFEATYEGVSERGQALNDTFKVRPSSAGMGHLPVVRPTEGDDWQLSHAPHVGEPDDDEASVGRSEGLRIAAAIPLAAAEYLDGHRASLYAAALIRNVRRLAMQEASVKTAELRLASDRQAVRSLSARVSDLEASLSEELASLSSPAP